MMYKILLLQTVPFPCTPGFSLCLDNLNWRCNKCLNVTLPCVALVCHFWSKRLWFTFDSNELFVSRGSIRISSSRTLRNGEFPVWAQNKKGKCHINLKKKNLKTGLKKCLWRTKWNTHYCGIWREAKLREHMQKSSKLYSRTLILLRIILINVRIKLSNRRMDMQTQTHTHTHTHTHTQRHSDTLRAQQSLPCVHQLQVKNRLTIETPGTIC
jgi:hypothetical protein